MRTWTRRAPLGEATMHHSLFGDSPCQIGVELDEHGRMCVLACMQTSFYC